MKHLNALLRHSRSESLRSGFEEHEVDLRDDVSTEIREACKHFTLGSFFYVFGEHATPQALAAADAHDKLELPHLVHSYGNQLPYRPLNVYPILLPYELLTESHGYVTEGLSNTLVHAITDLVNDLDDQTFDLIRARARRLDVPAAEAHSAFLGFNGVMGMSVSGPSAHRCVPSASPAYGRLERPDGLFTTYRRRRDSNFAPNELLSFSSRTVHCASPDLSIGSITVTGNGLRLSMLYSYERHVHDQDIPILSRLC